jgi:hypothetical protein
MPGDDPAERHSLEPSESLDPFEWEGTERWPSEGGLSAVERALIVIVIAITIVGVFLTF